MNSLSLEKLFFFAFLFWILNFFWSIFTITPNVDDSWYFVPSLGLAHLNELAFHTDNYIYYDFSKFPIFSFLQGIFLKFFLLFHIPINFYTYRFFPIIVFCFLIFSTFKLIEIFSTKLDTFLYKKTLFLILISVSPFSMHYMTNRPEILGLFFLISGIFFYLKSRKKLIKKKLNLFITGFFLSLSIFTHPSFFILNFLLVPLILCRGLKFENLFPFLSGLIVPSFFMLFYYYFHLPISLEQLFIQSSGFPYFGWFFSYLKGIFFNENFFINLINFYYYIPYFFSLIFVTFIFINKFFIKDFFSKDIEIIKVLLLFSILVSLFTGRSTYYNHSIYSYLVFLFIISDNCFERIKQYFEKYILTLPGIFLIPLVFFAICSWNIIHTLKYYYFSNKYLINTNFLEFKNFHINNNKKFIITRSEFIPFFIKEMNNNLSFDFKNSKFFWLFPNSGRSNSLNDIKLSKEFIKNKFINKNISDSFWIIAKKNIIKMENQFLCISIHDGVGLNHIQIKLENYLINYNTHKYIILNSNKISLECI